MILQIVFVNQGRSQGKSKVKGEAPAVKLKGESNQMSAFQVFQRTKSYSIYTAVYHLVYPEIILLTSR